jgi:hypothetical protein
MKEEEEEEESRRRINVLENHQIDKLPISVTEIFR